jgi:putative phosphoesterase
MKILIVSDTHSRHKNLEEVLERVSPIDLLIHLGDAEGHEDEIEEMAGCPLEIVSGNNDFGSALDDEKMITIGKYKILLTHGHYYYPAVGLQHLVAEAQNQEADIIMFGHTHRPLIKREGNVIALNPGSVSLPRQEGHKPSYIIMDVDEKGKAHFSLCYLGDENNENGGKKWLPWGKRP